VDLSEAAAAADPRGEKARRGLLEAYLQYGRAHGFGGEPGEAEENYKKMHDLAERWVADVPDDNRARGLLATSYRKLGDAKKLAGDFEAACANYRQAIEIGEKILDADSGDLRSKGDLAAALDDLAGVVYSQRQLGESRALYAKAERLFLERLEADPDDLDTQNRLVHLQTDLARLEADESQFDRAVATAEGALDRLRRLERQGRIGGPAGQNLVAAIGDYRRAPEVLADLAAVRARPPREACRLLALCARVTAARGLPAEFLAAAGSLCDLEVDGAADSFEQALGLGSCLDDFDARPWPDANAAERQALRQRCADRAAAALARSVERGFRDVRRLEEDPDLTRVRRHPEYRRLVARLQDPASILVPPDR
jgi:tetratricopeptide (TPR) repeat protein